MSVLNENTIIGASAAGGGYEIDHSLRLHNRGGDGASTGKTLRRTPSVNSNRRTWTLSMWHKRGDINFVQLQDLFVGVGAGGGGDGVVRLRFERGAYAAKDKLWFSLDGPTPGVNAVTNRVFRDPSAWMHIVIRFDTTQSTVTDRARIYINGEVIPSTEYSHLWTSAWSNLAQNSEWAVNKAGWYESFAGNGSTSNPDNVLGGYLADIAFVDGQSLGPDSFGETGDYGEWKPIDVSGLTFGTNGYHLDFADSSAMGNDANGSNNFSVYNITANDQMLDSPTNNFCTFDGVGSHVGVALSEGNLLAKRVSSSNWHRPAISSFDLTTHKCYWEVHAISRYIETGIVSTEYFVGADAGANSNDAVRVGTDNASGTYGGGLWYVNNSDSGSDTPIFVNGQVLMFAYDPDTRKLFFGANGTWYDNAASSTASPSSGGTAMYTYSEAFAAAGLLFTCGVQTSHTATANFGQDSSFAGAKTPQGNQDANLVGDFFYPVPSGFLALCTKNLPSADVIPSEHFNTVLYTGTGANQSITGVGFEPSLVWMKNRSASQSHALVDVVRGRSKVLFSDATNAEQTSATVNDDLVSFDSDGFTVGPPERAGSTNNNGSSIVAWNWKAGGTAVSNTNGTITSSVSANPSAGFSIVSYTGTGAIAATIGHGLAQKPELIIRKDRDTAVNWVVNSTVLGTGNMNQGLFLNTTASIDTAQGWMNNTAPTSTVFTQGDQSFVGVNGRDYISYCFHSVDGYSKVGSYTGNGSADGPFVHCGFRPAWVMIKRTDNVSAWSILDSARDTYNPVLASMYADHTVQEIDETALGRDYLSNGFKLTGTYSGYNASGGNYIFLAFAETPFKHSNAR